MLHLGIPFQRLDPPLHQSIKTRIIAALATVDFWDAFHRREIAGATEWYLPLEIVVREVLAVRDQLKSAQKCREEKNDNINANNTNTNNTNNKSAVRRLLKKGRENDDGKSYPRILHPGCGSSTVGVILQREHGCAVVNADFVDEEVLDKFRARYPGCEFVCSDARRTEFADGSFDLAIDKGLFDSATAKAEGRAETARKFLGEAARILAPGGKYMLFSVFGNDGFGHKDMQEMLAHPGFGGEVEVKVLDTPPLEYPDQDSSYLYILTKVSPPTPPRTPPSSSWPSSLSSPPSSAASTASSSSSSASPVVAPAPAPSSSSSSSSSSSPSVFVVSSGDPLANREKTGEIFEQGVQQPTLHAHTNEQEGGRWGEGWSRKGLPRRPTRSCRT